MTEEEALELDNLSEVQMRAHPRYIAPEQAVPDAQLAALRLAENAFDGHGAEVYSSSARTLTDARPRAARSPRRPFGSQGRRRRR
jgi:hypothetical protein